MSDNEDTTTVLGDSEVLSVQHPPCAKIPEFPKRPEEDSKVPSSFTRHDTGDVFPKKPARSFGVGDSEEFKHEVSSGVFKSFSESLHAEGLAGGSADEEVNGFVNERLFVIDGGHISKIRNIGIAVLQYIVREFEYF
jgi:hypothetical protein